MRRILVTGGAGFIGSHFVHYLVREHPELKVVVLDALTYAGSRPAVQSFPNTVRFVHGDIRDESAVAQAMRGVEAVVHMAAETHVDRSIHSSDVFIQTNVVGTHILLECARRENVAKFVYVSTDEVYGSLGPTGRFTEESPMQPNNPYAASKASADMIVRAFQVTYGFPACISRCSNNFGPNQFPEKLIPKATISALHGQPIQVYGDGQNVRDWIHVSDHCRAIACILFQGNPGEVYNISANNEYTNLELVREVLRLLQRPDDLIKFVPDRLGHDRRYALDSSKLTNHLGWQPTVDFHHGLKDTVDWYVRRYTSGGFH